MCEAGRATRSDTPHDVPGRVCVADRNLKTKLARFGKRRQAVLKFRGHRQQYRIVAGDFPNFLELFRRGIEHQIGRMCAAVAGFG